MNNLRLIILKVYKLMGKLNMLLKRAEYCSIGFTGNVSSLDKEHAKKQGYKSLNKFEMWLLRPIIEHEKTIRQDCFEKVCNDVLGE